MAVLQTNHFYLYAPEQVPYAQKRYLTESKRLLSVLDKQLGQHSHVAGADYSIADMAIFGWVDHFLGSVTHSFTPTSYHRPAVPLPPAVS